MAQTIKGIRIVSGGAVFGMAGTKIFSEDGEDLTGKLRVRSVQWSHEVGKQPVAILECLAAAIDVTTVDAEIKVVAPSVAG